MRDRLLQSGWVGAVWIAGLLGGLAGAARADVALIDASHLRYQIDTGETATTGNSNTASGAALEADYTMAIHATTQSGGTSSAMPLDTFDGYSLLALSFAVPVPTGSPSKKDAAFLFYNITGAPATLDSACGDRQVTLPKQTLTSGADSIEVQRLVFVPADDEFIRWINILHNPGAATVAFHVGFANNLGSDDKTLIVTSSDGNATAEISDTWVTTMQDYSNKISLDPRIGHVLQGAGTLRAPLSVVSFVNGNDTPFWWYDVSLKAGETASLMMFASPQPNKADASAKAAELVSGGNAHMFDCVSKAMRDQMLNFRVQCALAADDGEACDDENPCTENDTCANNACAGTPKDCRSKASDCTGVCNPSTGACDNSVNLDDDTSCSNGNVCDGDDTCQSGKCTATGDALDCDDGERCTADACDANDGCSNTLTSGCKVCATTADCDDDDMCNGAETCANNGTCRAGAALNCNDLDNCTSDTCLPSRGCRHADITTGTCAPDAGGGGQSGSGGSNGSSGSSGSSSGSSGSSAGSSGSSGSGAARDGGDGADGSDAGLAASGSHGGPVRGKDVAHSGGCSCAALGSAQAGMAGVWLFALACIARRRRLVA